MFFSMQERLTTGVHVDDPDLNHFVMVPIRERVLNRLVMKLRPLKRFIYVSANILEILQSVMELIIPSRIRNCPKVVSKGKVSAVAPNSAIIYL
jgi:hypothetical protein